MPRGGKAKKVKYKGKTYSTATSGGGASPRDIARAIQLGQIALQAAAEKAREEELRKKNLKKQQEVARASKLRRGSTKPVHGFDAQGRKVTVAFGTGAAEGDTYIADGHVSAARFWERKEPSRISGAKGITSPNHDHFLRNGEAAGARGRYKGVGSYTPDRIARQEEG